jgi:Heterokaryon incompatibility protein Het-C
MSREMDGIERIQTDPSQGGKKPEDMVPEELHAVLLQVLSFRDSIVRKISNTIKNFPGLQPFIDQLMESISGRFPLAFFGLNI